MNCLIESDRLRLRKFTLLDAEDFYQMTQDDAIQEYTSYAACTSIEDAEEKISDSYIHGNLTQDFYLVIEEKDTGAMVGAIIATTSIKNNIFTFFHSKCHRVSTNHAILIYVSLMQFFQPLNNLLKCFVHSASPNFLSWHSMPYTSHKTFRAF